MDKNVKKIISEAFSEIYEDFVSEDAKQLEAGLTPQEKAKAEETIQRAKKYGDKGGFAYDFYQEDKSGQKIFNYVADRLVDDYKETGNIKSKEALQAALYPAPGSKMFNAVKWPGKSEDEMLDITSAGYEYFLNNFDKVIDLYKSGTGGLSGLVLSNLKKFINTSFAKGFRGAGLGGAKDVVGRGMASSMDATTGDDTRTLGDKIAAGELGVDTPTIGTGFSDEESGDRRKKILDVINGWLENNASKKQAIAFKELTKGQTPAEVYEANPEMFRDNKDVSRNFKQLMSRTEKDEEGNTVLTVDRLSDLISHAYGIDFDMKNIIPKNLRQTVSMDPEFSGLGSATKIASPEVKKATKDFNNLVTSLGADVLNKIGVRNKRDYENNSQINNIADKLINIGMEDKAEEIQDAWENVRQTKKQSSETGKVVQYADKDDVESFSGMFEGFDMDALMDRVYKRIL